MSGRSAVRQREGETITWLSSKKERSSQHLSENENPEDE